MKKLLSGSCVVWMLCPLSTACQNAQVYECKPVKMFQYHELKCVVCTCTCECVILCSIIMIVCTLRVPCVEHVLHPVTMLHIVNLTLC